MGQLDRFRRLLGMGQSDDRRSRKRVHARRGTRVLIVDDSRTISAALSHMLRQNGYETMTAEDAESALEMVVEQPPELIFLDIVLPGMSGFKALRQFRRLKQTAEVPIIMISGNPQAVEQFYLKKIGADDFMKKPFGRAEVFARLERLVVDGVLEGRGSLVNPEPVVDADADADEIDSQPATESTPESDTKR
ncbi:response regulator [Wenzhouxiangella sp. AB-CW3]|uniref:response regulator n=1 Tax=Wenzhouxiangella sp. AB-CW3 TaxID=2771012 RepID=UPI00168A9705|nr:response regulator [Wenzhouxiangella sp. AB-CW3]QOC21462.1 response regulator [Wenzhouxiangella sp. AB-CW3]